MEPLAYFFYEWLIIQKNMTKEEFESKTPAELTDLRCEFLTWYNRSNKN